MLGLNFFTGNAAFWKRNLGDLNKHLKKKIQNCQNKTVRFLKTLGPRPHIGFSELDSLNMLNVGFRVKHYYD